MPVPNQDGSIRPARRAPTLESSTALVLDSLRRAFPGASDERLQRLAVGAVVREVRAAETVCAQGQPLRLMIAVHGLFSIGRLSSDGRRYTLGLLSPGAIFGYRAARANTVSMSDLVALTDGLVVELRPAALQRLDNADAPLADALMDHAAGVIALLLQRLDEASFDSARKRLATALLVYERVLSRDSIIRRSELASIIGTSVEMLRHVLRDFEAQGLVRRVAHRLEIRDRAGLARVAEWAEGGAEHAAAMRVWFRDGPLDEQRQPGGGH